MRDKAPVTSFPVLLEPLLPDLAMSGSNTKPVPLPFDAAPIPDIIQGPAPDIPEVSEVETVRHFTRLSRLNYGIDAGMYPLGSCTMKHNPRITEEIARCIAEIHPADAGAMERVLGWLMQFRDILLEICGMDDACLWPAAGAHGELTGMLVIGRALRERGEVRPKVLVPDTAHGTNPASCAVAGFAAVNIPSGPGGYLRPEDIAPHLDDTVAALMITNPNTLGVFEASIETLADMLHDNGSYLYMDGANLNAILGVARPGDMGVDCMHVNLHKTFGAPHGGGGPGSGPVLVKDALAPYLPVPRLELDDGGRPCLKGDAEKSIGRVHGGLGNVAVILKALAWTLGLGAEGLRRTAHLACLKANYLKKRLEPVFKTAGSAPTLHEFVLSDAFLKQAGVTAMDIAKALMDRGFHAPTVYFPLIVQGAVMVEPTESEPLRELDRFALAMEEIVGMALDRPGEIHDAPRRAPVERVDEVLAARKPVLTWKDVNPTSEDRYLNG